MDIQEIFSREPFAGNLGIVIDQITDEYIQVSLKVDDKHLNLASVVHGGVVFTLADYAMGIAANQSGDVFLSIQSDIRFVASARKGDTIIARAYKVMVRNRISYYRAEVMNSSLEPIAIAEGMFHRKGDMKITDLNL
ncbi:MAG: PaaI family thioesterase [Rikenellaceae bacterium]